MMPNKDRTAAVAHYIIARARADQLGATKLNKIMWFADLHAYRKTRQTISGQTTYKKRQYGPVPNTILTAIKKLKDEKKIAERMEPRATGYFMRYLWLEQPDTDGFTAVEIDILNEAISWVCNNHTATSISDLTHDALWDEIELGGDIPIGAAAVIPGEVTPEDIDWALREMEIAE